MTESMHIGRTFDDTRLEDDCPCPKEPCGLVRADRLNADCMQHPMLRQKTIRQSHPSFRCPAVTS